MHLFSKRVRAKQSLFIRGTVLLMTLLCLVSAVMTATYTWKDLSQTAQNKFYGRPFYVQLLKLQKLYEQETETPVKNAEFYLFLKQESGDKQIGDRYLTDADGFIKTGRIAPGDYYFLETNPTYAFGFDTENDHIKNKYYFTVSEENADEENIIKVLAYNARLTADLQISKIVKSSVVPELSGAQKNNKFIFTVEFGCEKEHDYTTNTGESGTIKSGDTIALKHGEIVTIKNLPVGVTYRVTEQPQKGIAISSKNHAGNITRGGTLVEYTNTYGVETLQADSLTISKTVQGEAADASKKFKFTVTFEDGGTYKYRINSGNEMDFVSGNVIELKHGERAVFPEIPVGTGYTVEEDADGYSANIKKINGSILESGVELDFINHKTLPSITGVGNLEITKTVKGNYINPEKEFEFTVYFTDVKAKFNDEIQPNSDEISEIENQENLENESSVLPDETKPPENTPTEFAANADYVYRIGDKNYTIKSGEKIVLKHGETAVFENLPEGVLYEITEDDYSADGYFGSIKNVSGYIVKDETAEIEFVNENLASRLTVKKIVVGTETDKDFKFTVIIDGKSEEITLKAGEEKVFDLPYGAVYEVLEDDYFDEEFIQSGIENGYGTGSGKEVISTKTNSYVGFVMMDIEGSKTWVLPEDKTEKMPENIIVMLKKDDLIVQSKTVVPNEDGEWKFSFNVPEFDENGEKIEYILEETPVNGFVSKVEDFNITNTYINPIILEMPKLNKTIEGDTPETDAEFIFKLDAVADAPMPENSQFGSQLVTINGAGESRFDSIIFETTGVYKYKISELVGDTQGYTYDNTVYDLTVTVTEENGELQAEMLMTVGDLTENHTTANFVNSYDKAAPPPPGKTSVSVTKIWKGTSNPPESIQVQLYKNGSAYGAPETITKADGWKCIWTDLDENANWTVDEVNVPGKFTKTISGDAENGFVITNTYNKPVNPSEPDSPKTGDNSNVLPWILLLIFSGSTLALHSFMKKNYKGRYYKN